EAPNYDITYRPGIFTITKAAQDIRWNQSFDDCIVGQEVELTATASSGLEIKYESSNPEIATINENTLRFLSDGNVIITATQSGNENYLEAAPVEISIKILPESVKQLFLEADEIKIKEGESRQLSVSWVPDDIEIPELVWYSSNPEYATVDTTGLVNGIKQGESTIKVYIKDHPDIFASCVVTVGITSGIDNTALSTDTDYIIDNNKLTITTDLTSPVTIYSIDGNVIDLGFVKEISLQYGIYILHLNGKSFKLKI
ncbi:MAG: Ig-like domain-containing protein, partial [Muribaculaceae bacterium]|nr:Ig-like domain-containing protein [Muribaculaceae bacterium]